LKWRFVISFSSIVLSERHISISSEQVCSSPSSYTPFKLSIKSSPLSHTPLPSVNSSPLSHVPLPSINSSHSS
jgi:hypothetical protein